MPKNVPFYTVEETADILQLSYGYVLRMLQEGKIKGHKPSGGHWRVPQASLEEFANGRPQSAAIVRRMESEGRDTTIRKIVVDDRRATRIHGKPRPAKQPPGPEQEKPQEDANEEIRPEPATQPSAPKPAGLNWSIFGKGR